METIKVNMAPCEDIKTIHASQNDGEAREWGFILHNNGDVIDSSEITDQMVFKAYEGGTEQILPTNGSTPTTSPFNGDIKYPQGLLSDQEFLYRQSPTEEDGLAKITDVKGNTLVWNQLVQNGNFADTSNWYARDNATLTVSDNVGTLTTASANISAIMCRFSYVQGHKYLIKLSAKGSSGKRLGIGITNNNGTLRNPSIQITPTTSWEEYSAIGLATESPSSDVTKDGLVIRNMEASAQTVELKNVQVFDLTQMGLDITDPSEFTSLFPLSYYPYTNGELLSFNGSGIKTVGKNLFDENSVLLSQGFVKQNDGSYYKDNLATLSNALVWNNDVHINGALNIKYQYKYINGTGSSGLRPLIRYTDGTEKYNYPIIATDFTSFSLQTDPTKTVDKIVWDYGSSFNGTYIKDFIISVDNIDYEPYTSSTLSLPISTYFTNGMKSAGSVYDELTETKAITRIGSVDLGSLTWNRMAINEGYAFVSNEITDMIPTGNVTTANVLCPPYTLYMSGNGYSMANDKTFRVGGTYFGTRRAIIRDDSYTDATAFKTAMSGVYLYYELATPTEISFTTASLVTENAEIPLSNEDGVLIGKCTEELSAEPGFIDAKIKLTDGDGTCYSNKIQLHVERKPS